MTYVLAVALLLGIIVIAVGWMVAASAFAGSLLWIAQRDVASSHSFAWVRRYGLLKGAWILIRVMRRRRTIARRLLTPSARRRLITVLALPSAGFIAPTGLLYIVSLLLHKPAMEGEFADELNKVILLTGSPASAIAVVLFVRGLCFIAEPDKQRRGLPQLHIPQGLSRQGRDRLALNVFWYETSPIVGAVAAVYSVTLLVSFVSTLEPASTDSTYFSESAPPLVVILFLALTLVPVIAPAQFAAAVLRRRLAAWRLPVEICELLTPAQVDESAKPLEVPEAIPGTTEPRRARLIRVAELLVEAAARVDARQPRGFTPHPTATLLRAVSGSVRQHLQGPASYERTLPPQTQETLRIVLRLLAEPPTAPTITELARRTRAFDEEGRPAVESFAKPPGRLSAAVARLTTSVQRTATALAAVAGIAATLLAVSLAIVGKLDSGALLGHLK
ncbi:hypothetical protein [Micromonospora craniellae]|uniref:hypothetical protein n=1 Tax=Micromonospora craniellae TaxID=2294034 RepID=UPI0011C18A2D|nr:hypothetical protein [Micromonospora craniellae]QOC94727.1 hypothetical protein ID554_14970 [Micromonospora craniellae]